MINFIKIKNTNFAPYLNLIVEYYYFRTIDKICFFGIKRNHIQRVKNIA